MSISTKDGIVCRTFVLVILFATLGDVRCVKITLKTRTEVRQTIPSVAAIFYDHQCLFSNEVVTTLIFTFDAREGKCEVRSISGALLGFWPLLRPSWLVK